MQTATFPTYDTVDLFAGPGGWSLAARRLGLREIGIEFDKAAHLTRRAAGFHTIRDDVRAWGPGNFPNARGLIASPPCQTFSAAGKGAGRRALDVVLGAIKGMHLEHLTCGRYDHASETYVEPTWEDERTGLVLEPLRWALDAIRLGKPYEWLAFEQVPTVLPVWQAMADVLRAEGYSVAVGNLQAEQYGVPQTRKRAVLIARLHRDGTCDNCGHLDDFHDEGNFCAHAACASTGCYASTLQLPAPTHSRYHTRAKDRLDPGVLPWVSMAQALGWGLNGRPSPTVTGGGTEKGGAEPIAHLSRYSSDSTWMRSSAMENATIRSEDEPAPTITAAHDTGERVWFAGAGQTAQDTAGQIPRDEAEPAHTVTGKGTAAWIGARFGNQEHSAVRAVDEPAATIRYGERMNANDWTFERPATTVVGSFNPDVIAAPGYRTSVADGSRQNAPGSVRVSVEEAGVLQSFPRDYPWQGSRTKQYQQVGNAIPPLLAEAVLSAVLGVPFGPAPAA